MAAKTGSPRFGVTEEARRLDSVNRKKIHLLEQRKKRAARDGIEGKCTLSGGGRQDGLLGSAS